jgi:reactive intermediate/imine deaminase
LASLAIGACKPTSQPPASPTATSQTSSSSDEAVEYLNSDAAPPGLPFSEAVRVGDLLLLSGQIGTRNGEMAVVPGGLEAEARQTMDNIRGVLERNGLGMQHVIKCTVMLADMAEWPAFNAIYREYFTAPYPVRSALGANGLALGARVEVECMASRRTPGRAAVAQ